MLSLVVKLKRPILITAICILGLIGLLLFFLIKSTNDQNNFEQIGTNYLDTSTWKEFNNGFVNFKYPNHWKSENDFVSSLDNLTVMAVSVSKRSELRKDITDYYVSYKSLESEEISNEREIKIDNLSGKSYDVAKEKKTVIILETQNYIYTFTLTPGATDAYLSKILYTVKIGQ